MKAYLFWLFLSLLAACVGVFIAAQQQYDTGDPNPAKIVAPLVFWAAMITVLHIVYGLAALVYVIARGVMNRRRVLTTEEQRWKDREDYLREQVMRQLRDERRQAESQAEAARNRRALQ